MKRKLGDSWLLKALSWTYLLAAWPVFILSKDDLLFWVLIGFSIAARVFAARVEMAR